MGEKGVILSLGHRTQRNMNLILLFPEDFCSSTTVSLSGRRFDHVREVHKANPGDTLIVGQLDGNMGTARVQSISENTVLLDIIDLSIPPPPKLPLTLIVGLPRPKVLHRILTAAACLGVAKLVFVAAARVEKSYWQSPKLHPDKVQEQLVLGLEQAKDTILPEVVKYTDWRGFRKRAREVIPDDAEKLLAHPAEGAIDCPRGIDNTRHTVLAIGPEGGWLDDELSTLAELGFRCVSIGPRILRTETAIPILIGRLF